MASQFDTELGARLRARRRALGLSLAQVGDAIGVTYQQIRKFEVGENRTSAAQIVALCRVLAMRPGELLGVEPPAEAGPERPITQAIAAALARPRRVDTTSNRSTP